MPLGSLWHKVLFAMKYQETNILLSGRVNADSKILYVREPKERVEKVAPWLTLDGDPYPAVVDGRIKWIVDGYTTSNGFPYSTRSTLEDATRDSRTTVANQQLVTPVEPPGCRDGEVNQQRQALRLGEHRTYFRVRVVPEVNLAEHGQSKHAALAAVEGRETAR